MKQSLGYKLHEWAAEHFTWVQYPDVKNMNAQPFFKYAMPFHYRVGLIVLGLVVLMFCAVALFFLGIIFHAILTA